MTRDIFANKPGHNRVRQAEPIALTPAFPPQDAAAHGFKVRQGEISPAPRVNSHNDAPPDTDPKRESLRLLAWTTLSLPPRDFLLGDLLCTTSRWILVGATGIGKTLFTMELAACVAAGKSFLGWEARRKCRVIYIDGEMPAETFKERMELVAERHGNDLAIYGYNRDRLGDERDIPPLDTQAGRDWLKREIEIVKPDLIIFDSIMCLVAGDLMKPEGWAPMLGVMRGLTSMRIAQIWLHHANDGGKVFGDKTKTWQMDTVASLTAIEDDDAAFGLNFDAKARLRTPANREQFNPKIIFPSDGWRYEIAKRISSQGRDGNDAEIVAAEFMKAYDRLADGVPKTTGLDGNSTVLKVSVAAIREDLKDSGFLDATETGAIERVSRNHFSRAKKTLLRRGKLMEKKGQIWRP